MFVMKYCSLNLNSSRLMTQLGMMSTDNIQDRSRLSLIKSMADCRRVFDCDGVSQTLCDNRNTIIECRNHINNNPNDEQGNKEKQDRIQMLVNSPKENIWQSQWKRRIKAMESAIDAHIVWMINCQVSGVMEVAK